METTALHTDPRRYFIECCRTKLSKEYLPKLKSAVAGLSDDDLWWRAHETNNSIGNLMLHLAGNVTQWIVSSLGGQEFVRDRNREFAQRAQIPLPELLSRLEIALARADSVLATLPEEACGKRFVIQKYEVTGMEAILHVTEHFSYHLGQIIFIAKLRTGRDLKFYDL